MVLAVGSVRGWGSALAGAGTALGVLAAIVLALGPALARIPLQLIQLGAGTLLLLFGMRWLRKAILRSAGLIPLHDEDAAFAKNREAMRQADGAGGFDRLAFVASFNITMLEGTEVVFIVIAIGAGGVGLWMPASVGAVTALLLVAGLGAVVHRPLARVPENTLKFAVGVLLSAFGSFWVGEGMGLGWPGGGWAIPGLIVAWLAVALVAVPLTRAQAGVARGGSV